MSAQPENQSFLRRILIGLIGNVMEWYDFAVYGYFAGTIGRLFFPSDNPVVSLMASFGAFAAGFLVRPLGGLLFGRIGDLVGRQRAMFLSVITMAVPTVLMALLPTYETIGFFAPLLLILLRMVQGLSVGGEFTSSLIFMVEKAPSNRKAFSAVWGAWGASAGTLLGSGVGFLMAYLLTPLELEMWGWRLAFLSGGAVAFVALWLRSGKQQEDSPNLSKTPVRDIFTIHRSRLVKIVLLNIGHTVGFYTIFVYAVSFLEQTAHFSHEKALRNNSIAMLFLLAVMPFAAKLADRIGHRKVLSFGFSLLAIAAVPLFHIMGEGIRWVTIACELGLALPLAILAGAIFATNVELMPREVRCSGLAFAYNLSVGVFGGMTPMAVTWMTAHIKNVTAPGYWVAGAAAISVATILFASTTSDKPQMENEVVKYG